MRPLNIVSLHHPTDEVNRDARTAEMAAIEINIKVGSHDSLLPPRSDGKRGPSLSMEKYDQYGTTAAASIRTKSSFSPQSVTHCPFPSFSSFLPILIIQRNDGFPRATLLSLLPAAKD